MDFLKLATDRYSVRSFQETPVPQESIDRILQAAAVAPTACNLQPQKIFIIQSPEGLAALRQSTECHFNAPLAFLIGYDKTRCWKRPFDGKASGDIDASIVTTHMMLEAASLGLGSTWVMFFDPAAAKAALHLPEEIEPVAFLPMGYPADDAKPAERHTLFRDPQEIVTVV